MTAGHDDDVGALVHADGREPADLKPPFFRAGEVLTRFHFDGDVKPRPFAGLSCTGKVEAAGFSVLRLTSFMFFPLPALWWNRRRGIPAPGLANMASRS